MTNEEAIMILKAMIDEMILVFDRDRKKALNMAIEALKEQPETSTEIQEILNYLDTTLHPIVSPDNWYVYAELHDMVSMLPSVQPEQRWIPCSERLPEPRIDVWCNSDMGQMVGYYEENVETWYGRDYLELMVTAWMPLPKPYKEESNGKNV